jgi:hypothetical protein
VRESARDCSFFCFFCFSGIGFVAAGRKDAVSVWGCLFFAKNPGMRKKSPITSPVMLFCENQVSTNQQFFFAFFGGIPSSLLKFRGMQVIWYDDKNETLMCTSNFNVCGDPDQLFRASTRSGMLYS